MGEQPLRRAPIYDLVAIALSTYARSAFRCAMLGAPLTWEPGTIFVSSHRSDADVPLIINGVYRKVHTLLEPQPRLNFAVRDDLFIRGFFAGYPPGLPPWARRLLWPLNIGPVFERVVPVHPIRSAKRMRLAELLRDHPDARLSELLPPELDEPLRERAAELGHPPPLRVRDVLRGEYADLLWQPIRPGDVHGPEAEESWTRRNTAAAQDFRRLVDVVRNGGRLLLFPEGSPSPDGEIRELRRGLGALVRRGRPQRLQPLAPAYDPLVRGKPHAEVGVGPPVAPPERDVEAEVRDLLRRATPLTVGQVVAAAREEGGDAAERLEEELARAEDEGRPFDPRLRDGDYRRARVAEAQAVADERPHLLDRLAREYRTARVG